MNSDIDQQIAAFAKQRRIKLEDFQKFRDSLLNGLRTMGLRTDVIDYTKFNEIAKRKDAQAIAKKQEVDNEKIH